MAKRAVRPCRVEGNLVFVPLTKGKQAVVDLCDLPLVEGINWHLIEGRGLFYAHRSFKVRPANTEIKLHRVILSPPPGMLVDHIDGDGLNCRRSNLRVVTQSQNMQNSRIHRRSSTGFKGVSFRKTRNKFQATIRIGGRARSLGQFLTAEEAYAAYCAEAARHYGEFANFG